MSRLDTMTDSELSAFLDLGAALDDVFTEFPAHCWPTRDEHESAVLEAYERELRKANATIGRCRRAWEAWRKSLDPGWEAPHRGGTDE